MVYVVTKLYVEQHKTEIIDIVDNADEDSYMRAYNSLLEDVLQFPVDSNSIKSVSRDRVEVHKRGMFGSSLACVYQIHDSGLGRDEDKTEE